ncbi:Spt20 family-domain-containing protein [Protomyces lactucae-debilis]|uniref:Spt20 family-domain-containing protein n=1 Tax=Protomyces lactucae-debilis TaxID=2754530 RepID=A0A1Y2FSN5_PROLT|nr:Spt20 family-domain-containing protein [Protomyces lactucae-debilis]ORY87003.1 Spt20 family-domain-containing protein [Protomyces lactucae-debilis]
METRGVTAATKVPEPKPAAANNASGTTPRIKIKQPSYRATLLRLSNSISHSSAEILQRYSKNEPSLILHFHQQHWRFEQQDGIFLYNSQGRQILECIRNEQIPVDCLEVFRDVKIKYYEGCLILRLVDHRSTPPTILHTALRPSPESIWTEMLLYSEQTQGNFTDAKALLVESDILVATNPPLNLKPAVHPAQVAQYLTDLRDPPLPRSKRRRGVTHDSERDKLMFLYDEGHGKDFAPDFKRLAFVEAHRRKRALAAQRTGATAATGAAGGPAGNVLTPGHAPIRSGTTTVPAIPANATPEEALAAQQQQVQQALAANRSSASPAIKASQQTPMSLQQQQQMAQLSQQQQQAAMAAATAMSNGNASQQQQQQQQQQGLMSQQQQLQQQQISMQGMSANGAFAARQAQVQAAAKRTGQSPQMPRQGMTPQQMAQQLAMHQAQLQQQQQQHQNGKLQQAGQGNNQMFDDLARQQQIMLQQRAMAIRNMQAQNAARQHAVAAAAAAAQTGQSPSPGSMHARLPQGGNSGGRSQTSSPAMHAANLQNGGHVGGSPALQQQMLQQQMQMQAMQAAAAANGGGGGGRGAPTQLQLQQMRQAHLVQQQQMAFNNANAQAQQQAHLQAKAQAAAAALAQQHGGK